MGDSGEPDEVATRRFGARAVLAFLALFLVSVPFTILTALVASKAPGVLRLDRRVAGSLHVRALEHPTFTRTMKVISNLGSPLAWWIILVPVAAWLAYRHRTRLATFVAVTAAGSSLLNRLLKLSIDRARPNLDDPVATAIGKSFPSGHTQAAIVGYGILLVVFLPVLRAGLRPLTVAGAVLMVLLVGFSRIALGVHFLSDVLGALLIGGAWLAAMTAAFTAWRRDAATPSSRG